jgi:hypothetical protein
MTYGGGPGGRIPPDNRPTQAKGIGKNSKRHDLERRTTPYLHGSDLQQGDVQALEQGQRVAPKQTQQPAGPAPAQQAAPAQATTAPAQIPDAIDFISQIAGGQTLGVPQAAAPVNPNIDAWLEFASHMANGPGASGLLAGAYINQMRQARRFPQNAGSVFIDLNDVDASLEAALNEEEALRAGPRS